MEVIRKFVDANSLMSILALPEAFRNRKLEIIVLPAGEDAPARRDGDVADIVRSLVGAVPRTDLTLSDLRDERLRKYEAADCYERGAGRPAGSGAVFQDRGGRPQSGAEE